MATLTVCEQAAIDLQAYKDALAAILTGRRVIELSHADKRIAYYGAGNVAELRAVIREKQLQVDACNGIRAGRAFRFLPVGW